MLALLIYSYANGIFSSRRIERATWRDIAVRFVAANLHPDHDTIAVFRRLNKAAFEAAFLQVLLLARESGLLRLGTVSIDGTKIDANASKIRSVRYDRAKALRAKLTADIAALTAQAEAADATDHDPQALPAELARREALKAKLDAACDRLEAEARAEAEAARPAYEAKKAAYDAKKGRRGRPPKPPDDAPPPERQSNLTDPDSALMRRSDAHEYRQAYNAQAVVCADGAQLILATKSGRDHSRRTELRHHHPGDGDNHRPAEYGPGRYRLCQRPGGGGPASEVTLPGSEPIVQRQMQQRQHGLVDLVGINVHHRYSRQIANLPVPPQKLSMVPIRRRLPKRPPSGPTCDAIALPVRRSVRSPRASFSPIIHSVGRVQTLN